MKSEMSTWFTHTSLGAWDPEGCLVCVIDDPADAARAVAALHGAGFAAEQLRLWLPEERRTFDDALRRPSMPMRVLFFLTNLSDDAQFEAEYREEARRGHPILVIQAPRRARYDRARELLRDYRARTVKYYGPWVVTGFD